MTSTTVTVDALARLKELQAEADQIQQDANERLGKVFAEMRDVSNAASGAYQIQDTNGSAPAPPPAPSATAAPTTTKKRRGRPPGKKNATAAKKNAAPAKKKGKGRNYDNAKPLRQVIWEVLSMSKRAWKKTLADLPSDASGLKAVEVATIIESQELWSSASPGSMATQISKHIQKFREEGKVTRGDHARYEIVEGANLDD